ncbi:hypothetical protein [Mesorhizobium sp. B2-7-1]|uniref:hypothetical protein n=1 Tax=Mesorhizobium sp. B2-7-1 TaxID=2589909 RepID=UPI001129CB4C|nr:hypothetical protein [Mesorhizobium sp. B2-7-1]TPJ73337.1 hypothetical protein FJ471_05120 [Mesorhizobium sp. B2-7-1]
MPTLRMGMKPVAGQPVDGRFFATAVEICRSGPRVLARMVRLRRDRVWLDELPDHLLRDIASNVRKSRRSSGTAAARTTVHRFDGLVPAATVHGIRFNSADEVGTGAPHAALMMSRIPLPIWSNLLPVQSMRLTSIRTYVLYHHG